MRVYIYNCFNEKQTVIIKKPVENSVIMELSGDQVLYVEYKDGTEELFDSDTHGRCQSFFDKIDFVKLKDGDDLEKYKVEYAWKHKGDKKCK